MSNDDIFRYVIPVSVTLILFIIYYIWKDAAAARRRQRIDRVTKRRPASSSLKKQDGLSLRRKAQEGYLPVISKMLSGFASTAALNARLERAGMRIPADLYIIISGGIFIAVMGVIILLHKSFALALMAGVILGLVLPHVIVSMKGKKRVKKFLSLFPDALEFIVRGLRSGLPVTESMNMVGTEMEEPIGPIFASMGESIRLGVPVEKTLQDMAKKLGSTEFNFFVTSIILQRETGGNLSEILNNLAEVLRTRFMMRMKIKAMSSEAKASAAIVGSLPFIVTTALIFVSPGYLDPLVDETAGNMVVAGACLSMSLGMGIMMKMSRFEI